METCPPLHLSRDTMSYCLVCFYEAFAECKKSASLVITLFELTCVSQDASLYKGACQKLAGVGNFLSPFYSCYKIYQLQPDERYVGKLFTMCCSHSLVKN